MKYIIFSQKFPKNKGFMETDTFFVEKIWLGLKQAGVDNETMHAYLDDYDGQYWHIHRLSHLALTNAQPKITTIRGGNRWKQGDVFEPRIWSGKPYTSPQIAFAPPLEVVKVQTLLVEKYIKDQIPNYYVDNELIGVTDLKCFSKNDGLSWDQFLDWFNTDFEGQIIHFKPLKN